MAEKYHNISPYAYVANNPIRNLDPDGNGIIDRVKTLRTAKQFANATGGRFVRHTKSYRKRHNTVATVQLHGTTAGLQVRQSYAQQTGRNYGSDLSGNESDNVQSVSFSEGGDYSGYFAPVTEYLANGAVALIATIEAVVAICPSLVGILTGNEEINADAVASTKVDEMAKTKKGKSAEVKGKEHTKGARKSTENDHQKGQTRKQQKNTDKKRQNKKWRSNK